MSKDEDVKRCTCGGWVYKDNVCMVCAVLNKSG
jgi:hypothetical protein